MITDIYQHPVFQQERREKHALQRRNDHLEDLLRVSLNRDLQTRSLEPINPHPVGLLSPILGGLITVHVDAMRIRANRLRNTREPVIRLLNGDAVWHCHELRLTGPSWMAEAYDRPIPGRASAVCVLQTADPVEVVR